MWRRGAVLNAFFYAFQPSKGLNLLFGTPLLRGPMYRICLSNCGGPTANILWRFFNVPAKRVGFAARAPGYLTWCKAPCVALCSLSRECMSSSCQIEAGEPWGVSPRSSGCSTSHRVPAGALWPTLQASIARSTNTLALSVLIFSAPFNSGKPLGCWRDRKGFGPLTLAHFALENSPQGGVAKRTSHSPISEREGVAIYCVLAGICNQFVTSLVFSGVNG